MAKEGFPCCKLGDEATRLVLLGILMVSLVFVAYLPALRAGFIWDDDGHLTKPALRSLGGLLRIWTQPGATQQYYPLVHSIFWAAHKLWGDSATGYHALNIFLHALAALLSWKLLSRLRVPGAWLASAIWGLHPVNVESVAWVSELKNTLSAVFYLGAALAWLSFSEQADGRRKKEESRRLKAGNGSPSSVFRQLSSGRYWLAIILFAFALFSKTVTCSLPATLLLVAWWKRGRLSWRTNVLPLLPLFAMGLAAGLFTIWIERRFIGAAGQQFEMSFAERILIAGRALWFYASKLVWPVNLTFIYPRWDINTAVWWQWLFPLSAVGLFTTLWALRQRLGRGPLVAALFFAGTLFPALGFFNVYPMRYSFVADHFQYLASIGLIALCVAVVVRVARYAHARPFPHALAAVVLPVLAMLTWCQSKMYGDLETLWRVTIQKNPTCYLAHNNLANLFLKSGRVDEAIVHYKQSLAALPNYAEAQYNLGMAYLQQGCKDQAKVCFMQAADNPLGNLPLRAMAHNNLGELLLQENREDEALSRYYQAVHINPASEIIQSGLATALLRKGQVAEALMHFYKALEIAPDYTAAANNLAWILATYPDAKYRDGTEAVRLAERACELTKYEAPLVVGTLAAAYAEAGRFDEAVTMGEKARELALAAGQQALAEKNAKLIELYRARQPYRDESVLNSKYELQNKSE